MMEETNDIVHLLHLHIRNELDDAGKLSLRTWANEHPAHQQLLDEVEDEMSLKEALRSFKLVYGDDPSASIARMEKSIAFNIERGKPSISRKRLFPSWIGYAAAAIILLGIGLWATLAGRSTAPVFVEQIGNDIHPGGNRANLTLADGQVIELSDTQQGILITNNGITYQDGTTVVEWDIAELSEKSPSIILSTPKGGTYQITLSDGTNVWLNAASVLRYPPYFNSDIRELELEGEAYFDVAVQPLKGDTHPTVQNAQRQSPLRVKSPSQTIEVLGTQFNINAYSDEESVSTTLVSGSIRITPDHIDIEPLILEPGNQALLMNGILKDQPVDIAPYIAWRKGNFYFDATEPQVALNQLSRWYDIEVVYEGEKPSMGFYGMIARDKSLISVLSILEETGLEFRMEHTGNTRKLVVLNE